MESLGTLTIRMGQTCCVHASEIFTGEDCGVILETKDFSKLLLFQDGEFTPVSDLMGRENHIFTVVPKTAVQAALDWRLPLFEAGPYLLAFDGLALLVLAMQDRGGSHHFQQVGEGQ